jgi:hypothetical protein
MMPAALWTPRNNAITLRKRCVDKQQTWCCAHEGRRRQRAVATLAAVRLLSLCLPVPALRSRLRLDMHA